MEKNNFYQQILKASNFDNSSLTNSSIAGILKNIMKFYDEGLFNRHRALTHNTWFISTIIPKIFGETFQRKSDGGIVSTRDIAETHVFEDYHKKFIPTASDFLNELEPKDWMNNGIKGYPQSFNKLNKKNHGI